MTPEQLSEFKKAFRAAAEKAANNNKTNVYVGGKAYSVIGIANEIEQETALGKRFTQAWESLAFRHGGVDAGIKKLLKSGLSNTP